MICQCHSFNWTEGVTVQYEIIINPESGSGKGLHVWQVVKKALNDQHIPYKAHLSNAAGQPRVLAAKIGQVRTLATTCVIVIGGDGTLHEVIDGLMHITQQTPLPVAYIPAGTGNDFARGYGISTKPFQALHQILDNHNSHTINVGQFINREQRGIFLNNFGIGFDAAIVHQTNASRMKRFLNHHHLGTLSYISKAIGVLIHQPAFDVQVTMGKYHYHYPNGFLVVSSNHPYIGGGIRVAPDQKIDQNELELVVLEKRGPLRLLGSIILFALGQVTHSPYAHVFHGSTIDYQIAPAQDGQIDGEELGQQAFQLHLSCASYPVWEQPL